MIADSMPSTALRSCLWHILGSYCRVGVSEQCTMIPIMINHGANMLFRTNKMQFIDIDSFWCKYQPR
jgi:hypothetical protein